MTYRAPVETIAGWDYPTEEVTMGLCPRCDAKEKHITYTRTQWHAIRTHEHDFVDRTGTCGVCDAKWVERYLIPGVAQRHLYRVTPA